MRTAGEPSIYDAIKDAAKKARETRQEVHFTHNGIPLVIKRGQPLYQVMDDYCDAINARNAKPE